LRLVLSRHSAFAQDVAQKDSTFSTGVNVVNILATVRQQQGRIVRNLTKDDFAVAEDERPQTIRYFLARNRLTVDPGIARGCQAAASGGCWRRTPGKHRVLNQVLREDKDQAFLIQFQREVELTKELDFIAQGTGGGRESLNAPEAAAGRRKDPAAGQAVAEAEVAEDIRADVAAGRRRHVAV